MTPADFEHITAGAESIALSIAAIIGGIWAAYQFRVLKKVKNALAELDSERAATRKALAEAVLVEQQAREKAKLTVKIAHRVLQQQAGVDRPLLCEARCHNQGNKSEIFDLSKTYLTAFPVKVEKGQPLADKEAYISGVAFTKGFAEVEPGEKLDLPFLFFLPAAGLYHLHFITTISSEGSKQTKENLKSLGVNYDHADLTLNTHLVVSVT